VLAVQQVCICIKFCRLTDTVCSVLLWVCSGSVQFQFQTPLCSRWKCGPPLMAALIIHWIVVQALCALLDVLFVWSMVQSC
jgi:hypothetical protein